MINDHVIKASPILLPKSGIDLSRFSVIACDQFTSQVDYWDRLKQTIGTHPSTFHMIFPEAYLGKVNHSDYIKKINHHIEDYLQQGILEDQGPCMILVERSTPYTKRRLGLVLAVDLDEYTYELGVHSLIRATEATILDRIPPRLKVRENASIEIPHTLLLIDDPKHQVLETLYSQRHLYEKVYDFELNEGGGHLRGYKLTNIGFVKYLLYGLVRNREDNLLFIVGDGNHSLATAKAHWNKIKVGLSEEEQFDHPAKYALVEVENLYDEGLTFEPIHRIVFHYKDDFYPGLQAILGGETHSFIYTNDLGQVFIKLPKSTPEAYALIQRYLDDYAKRYSDVEIDYIHGADDLIEIAKARNGFAIVMPSLSKKDLFDYIGSDRILSKKSFSMGHAIEKRYYLESKRIK